MSAAEERRRHARESIDHAALLEHADMGARACRLRDVSVSGALVVSEAGIEAGRCSPGDLVQMRFSAPPGVAREASDTHVVSGRVVRVLRNALGISFLDATARALGVLRRLADLHRHGHPAAVDHGAVLRQVAQTITAFQREQAPRFLNHLDACLLRAASGAIDDRDARILMDAHRALLTQRADLLARIEADLARQLTERIRPRGDVGPPVAGDDADFALLDLAALEGVLVAQRCLEAAEARDPRVFHRYRRALEILPPAGEGLRDPLDPQSLLVHFAEAARALHLEAVARPVLARAFEESFEAPLRQLLTQLVELMPAPLPQITPHAPRAQTRASVALGERAASPRASAFGDHGPLDGFPGARSGAPGSGQGMHTSASDSPFAGESLDPAGLMRPVPGSLGMRVPGGGWSAAGGGASDDGIDVATNRYPPGGVPLSGVLAGGLRPFAFPAPAALAPAALASRLLARQPGSVAGALRREAEPADWQQWFAVLATRMALEAEGVPANERASGLYRQLLVERADLGARPPGGELLRALQLAEAHWEALAADPRIHPAVLASLSRLRAWLHGWGLREPHWMLRDADPLALLLDHLTALWPNAAAETGVTELLEAVCQRLVEDPDHALADASLAQTLEGALAVQRQRAQDRIEALVRANDESWSNTLARRRSVASPIARPEMTTHPLRHWLALAQAWRRGDRAFLQRGRRTLPVELVWVDGPATDFLFVDPAGEAVTTMTRQELAVHLHRGTLRRMDHPHEPLSRRLRGALLERLACDALRVQPPCPALPGHAAASDLSPASGADADRTQRLEIPDGTTPDGTTPDSAAGVVVAAPPWREADGRILESGVLPLAGGVSGERFLEVVSVGSGDVAAPFRLPELAAALHAAGVRRRLDLALWDHALTLAEATAADGDFALRLSAGTLLAADGFEAFQSRLLEAAVPPRRITLVIDTGPGDTLPEALGELLHALDALGLRAALDASGMTLAGWRNLPVARVWVRAPEQGVSGAERERFAALADFARWAEWPLVATVGAGSLPAAELASLGVTHLAAPREWHPLPGIQ